MPLWVVCMLLIFIPAIISLIALGGLGASPKVVRKGSSWALAFGVIMLVVGTTLSIATAFKSAGCKSAAEDNNIAYKYSIVGKCRLQVGDIWIPKDQFIITYSPKDVAR